MESALPSLYRLIFVTLITFIDMKTVYIGPFFIVENNSRTASVQFRIFSFFYVAITRI